MLDNNFKNDAAFFKELAQTTEASNAVREHFSKRLEQMTETALSNAQNKPVLPTFGLPFLATPFMQRAMFTAGFFSVVCGAMIASLSGAGVIDLSTLFDPSAEMALIQDVHDYMTYDLLDEMI